jgi:hypothetical protein
MSGREWRHTAVLHQAWEAATNRKRASGATVSTILIGRTDVPQPKELEQSWTLWLETPWKRATFMNGTGIIDVVFHGTTWWSNGHGASRSSEATRYGHGLGWGEDLVRTPDYVNRLEIVHVETGSWLGRPTLDAQVRAVHRERERDKGLHGLIIGDADKIDLSIDLERGVILRAASWFEGSLYRTLEVLDVDFDVSFPPDTFKIDPLPGQDWNPPQGMGWS